MLHILAPCSRYDHTTLYSGSQKYHFTLFMKHLEQQDEGYGNDVLVSSISSCLNSITKNVVIKITKNCNPSLWSSFTLTFTDLQNLAANPELAQQIIGSNPLFAGSPVLQEQLRTMLPTFLNQMQNPEVQNFMTNPQVRLSFSV